MNRYDYTNTLLKALIDYHKLDIPRVSGFDFKATGDRHGIILGAGTTEILQLLALEALMGRGETVEAFPAYGQITRVGDELREAGYRTLSRRAPVKPDGNHDLDLMLSLITDRTGLVIVCNPHNPTGALLPHQDILKFIDRVPPNVTVAIDEVYIHFVRDPAYKDYIEVAKERENVIVLRTFSKAYGLGGVRVGYGVGHQKIIRRMAPFSMGLLGRNVLSVFAATAALADTDHVRRSQEVVWTGNDYLTAELKKLGFSVTPGHTNFLWVDIGRDSREIVRALSSKNVLVRAGEGQWDSPRHIRVSTGSMEENEAFIWALQQSLS
jgi:histidinol-phosphate aminotransferase